MKRPFESWIIIILLAFLSSGAFYGGISFILKPDGSILQIDTEWLNKSPFPDFLIPGTILLLFLGVLPALTLTGILTRKNLRFCSAVNCFPEKHWSWTFALYCGIITNIWIIVQQFLAGYFVLQPVIAATGLLILISTLLPRVQKYYSN